MASEPAALLPLHDFLSQLQGWQSDRSAEQLDRLRTSITRIADAYGATGVGLEVQLPPLAPLSVGAGTLRAEQDSPASLTVHELAVPADANGTARLTVEGQYAATNRLLDAFELSLSAVWSL